MSDITIKSLSPRFKMRGFLFSIVLNAVIPYLLYNLSKKFITSSELVALSIAAIFPIGDSVFSIFRKKILDLVAIITLIGIGISVVAILLGGNPKILLIRESFITGALGISCFISLLLPRPLMFYFGRQLMAGNDSVKIAVFNSRWKYPHARFVNRLITIVWGFAFTGEFILRVILVYYLPVSTVLLISPFILNGVTILTIVWTLAYIRYSIEHT